MDFYMATFGSNFIKKFIAFIILSQHVFCLELNKSNSKLVADGPNSLQNNLIVPNDILGELQLELSTDPRLRKIRSADDIENSSDSSETDNGIGYNVSLCASKIKLGEINEAVQYFNDLKKKVSLSDILNITYHSDNVEDELLHFRHIIDFVRELRPRSKTDMIAIKTIYQLLTSTRNLNPLKGVLFLYFINVSSYPYVLKNQYIRLMVKNTYFKNYKDRCVNVLHNGFKDEELKNFTITYYYPYVRYLLPEIFLFATKNKSDLTDRLDSILYFVHNYILLMEDWVRAYSHLYDQIKKHDLLSNKNITDTLGKDIKKFKEYPNYSSNLLLQEFKDSTEALCNSLESCKS